MARDALLLLLLSASRWLLLVEVFSLGSPRAAVCEAAEVFFEEGFRDAEWKKRWVHSTWKGYNGPAGRFELSSGAWFGDEKESKGLRTPSNMKYHSISAKLPLPISTKDRTFVLQFSVKHETQEYSFCGGGYIKLLGSDLEQATFGGDTPYKVMFGPDICGYDIARIHLIFDWKGEKLLRQPDIGLEYDEKNAFSHIYTLVLKPDNTYAVYLDFKEKASGSLHEHWGFPNKTHTDPADRKPDNWVDVKKIVDPADVKPDHWDDRRQIRDPEAEKPFEWDEDEDGAWEAPLLDNPNFKGVWIAQKIDNPSYKGVWKARQLENPDFVEDVYVLDDIAAVGFELWTVNNGSIFDNILLCDSFEQAKEAGEDIIKRVFSKEKDAKKIWEKAVGKMIDDIPNADDEEDDIDEVDLSDEDKKEL